MSISMFVRQWRCMARKYPMVSRIPARLPRYSFLRFHATDSPQSPHRLSDVLSSWTMKFEDYSIPDASSSAEFLIAHVKGLKTLHNVDMSTAALNDREMKSVNELCQLRLERMPVQYILGEMDFCDLTLKMRRPVLIPRPETEEFVKLCQASLEESAHKELPFLEIGCGTGAITLALLHIWKEFKAVAIDICPDACQLTSENAKAVCVDDRLRVMQGDINDDILLADLRASGPFCILVSNPPYVQTDTLLQQQPEILRFEDFRAFDGGADGLDLVKQILMNASSFVLPQCDVWIKVTNTSGVRQLADSNCFPRLQFVRSLKDMSGRDRFCQLQVTD